jgi:hypothetical protein
MPEVTTIASLVDYETLAGEESVTAVLERNALEAALGADSPGLWFEVGYEDEDVSRVTVELARDDVEEILRLSSGDDVMLALHAAAVASLLDVPEVEAHGMRGALTIAVVAGAMMAPAGLAATPQLSPAGASAQAAKSQVSRASVESQLARGAARSQVSRAAAKSQVSRASVESQLARGAARSQVSRAAAKGQLAKTLVVKASGVQALRLVR